MSTFRAFQTGLAAGQQQAKVRREDDARQKAAEAWGKGNYEGATTSLMGVGLMDEADAYSKAGERKIEAERTKAYADAFKTGLGAGPAPNVRGGYNSIRDAAAQQGDFKSMAEIDKVISGMDDQQAEQFSKGMEFLGQTALGLKQVAPEMRGQAAMEILQNSPYANPQILQQIQQAGADGKITDEELDNFAMQTMSVAERVKLSKQQQQGFTLGPGQTRFGPDGKPLATLPPKPPGSGIQLEFGEDGALSGLSIGGSGTKGNEPAIVRGPDGQPVVTPGKQQLASNKAYNALQGYEAQNQVVREDIQRALKQVGGLTTGLVGGLTSGIPGSPAHDLMNMINTIKANIGFDKLQQMRSDSPTGGALGQVSEQENKLLQSVLGALEQSQSETQLVYNLKRLDQILADNEGRKRKAFAQDYPSLAEYAGFAKDTVQQGNALQQMSTEELKKRAAELKAKAGKQ